MAMESPAVIQLRVLFALIIREMITRYGRNAGGYVWAVLEPLGTVALLSFVFSFIARRPPLGESFPFFFATGYLAFHFYVDISRNVSLAVSSNRALLSFPRVTIIDTIIARFILHVLTTGFVAFLLLGGLWLWLDEPVRLDIAAILTAVGLASLLGLGVGMLNCALFSYSATWQTAFGIINRPLFLISGVFFTYESLPWLARDILWWNPLVHVTAIMRSGFYPVYDAAFASPLYVALFGCAPLMAAMLFLKALRAQMLEQ
jgi:capsular polysaccharide transport system permease protein